MWPALSELILMGDTQKPQILAGDHSKEFGFLRGEAMGESQALL